MRPDRSRDRLRPVRLRVPEAPRAVHGAGGKGAGGKGAGPFWRILLLVVVALLASCTADDPAPAPSAVADPGAESEDASTSLQPDGDGESPEAAGAFMADPDCFGIEVSGAAAGTVTCGTVTVPLDHDHPDAEQIDLAVAMLAAADDAADEPLMVLGGGPGEVMLESVLGEPMLQELYATDRELILIDQRGVGASDPALDCPVMSDEMLADASGGDTEVMLESVRDCRDTLTDDGIDLGAFNYRNNALDIDAVRKALGHERIDLRGGSYGSHLALHAAALNPEGIRALVLSSPVDPSSNFVEEAAAGIDDAFAAVGEACETTPACADEIDDVAAAITEVTDRLDAHPAQVTVEPADIDETTLTFTPGLFLNGLFALFYLPDGAFVLPALVAEARDGDLEPLAELLVTLGDQLQDAMTAGMQYSMVCSGDGGLFEPDAAIASVGFDALAEHWFAHDGTFGALAPEVCEVWDVEQAFDPAEFTYAPHIPALVVTGELDHVTPPTHGDRIVAALDTAHPIEIPSVGHGPLEALDLFTQGCGQRIVEEFLTEPDRAPDSSCVDQMPPLEPLGAPPVGP